MVTELDTKSTFSVLQIFLHSPHVIQTSVKTPWYIVVSGEVDYPWRLVRPSPGFEEP